MIDHRGGEHRQRQSGQHRGAAQARGRDQMDMASAGSSIAPITKATRRAIGVSTK